jgi:hypothetical protein
MNVFLEAILVGLILIPVYYVSEMLVGRYGKAATIFAAGALFHLAADVTGLNRAYVMSKLA